MNTRAMSKQLKQSGDIDGQPEHKNVIKNGRKRGVNEAFPEYNESGESYFYLQILGRRDGDWRS